MSHTALSWLTRGASLALLLLPACGGEDSNLPVTPGATPTTPGQTTSPWSPGSVNTIGPSKPGSTATSMPGKGAGVVTNPNPTSSSSASSTSSAPDNTDKSTSTEAPMQRVTIQFKAMVGSQPFACGQSYEGMGNNASVQVEAIDFRFYVHNLRLIDTQGAEVPVRIEDRDPWQGRNLGLIDFENGDGACGTAGDVGVNAQITGWVKNGNYRGLKFSNSVPADLNHADPLTLGAPLHAGGMTWGWLTGYKFFAAELQQTNAKEGKTPGSAIFHIGSRTCDGSPDGIACMKSNRNEVVLPEFVLDTHEIVVDLKPIFAQADLSQKNPCHSTTEVCIPMFKAVGVDWETGNREPTQSAFSLEMKK